jgi:NTE family protein
VARRVVLTLQGGGALGAYQAGVLQALAEGRLHPDWVAGVSIGAVNAAIIAGNPPGRRVERLREFWDLITRPTALWPEVPNRQVQEVQRDASAGLALLFGQPGFFRPRLPIEWVVQPPPVSVYDTSELRSTLERLVDFDLINRKNGVRLSVGAVEVETGNLVYFDSARGTIGPDNVMASGALPPGLASVEVADHYYWDGGLVSNTPLQYVLAQAPLASMLVFQVDLFPAKGPLPRNLDQVLEREKDIRYSSRTRNSTDFACLQRQHHAELAAFLARLPPDLQADPVAQELKQRASPPPVDVVHLIYRPDVPQGAAKDYEFARPIIEQRWADGLRDGTITVKAAPWENPPPGPTGVRVFDVTKDQRT